jgi:hypothetical protein
MSVGNAMHIHGAICHPHPIFLTGSGSESPDSNFIVRIINRIRFGAKSMDQFFRSESDPLTKSAWRYNGFWNDGAEALHGLIPRWLYLTGYAITGTYAVGAVYYNRQQMIDRQCRTNGSDSILDENFRSKLNLATLDNTIWHAGATLLLTPLTIIGIKHLTKKALSGVSVTSVAIAGGKHMVNKSIPPMAMAGIEYAATKVVSPQAMATVDGLVRKVTDQTAPLAKAIDKSKPVSFMKEKFIPGMVGLIMIPVVVPPADNFVTWGMNQFRSAENQQPYHWTGLYSFLQEH